MFTRLKGWLGVGDSERQKLTDTEMLTSQDYKMAQSFSGEDIADNKVSTPDTRSF